MLYDLRDMTLSDGESAHLKACSLYRALAGKLVGSGGWCVEPVFLHHGDDVPASSRRAVVMTEEDGAEEYADLFEAVFRRRHGRSPGDEDVLVVLPAEMSVLVTRSDPHGRFGRCAAYDLGAMLAPMTGTPDMGGAHASRDMQTVSAVLTRLSCTARLMAAFYVDRLGAEAEIAEVCAWSATECARLLGMDDMSDLAHERPGIVVLIDLVARTSYTEGAGTPVCLDIIAREAGDLVEDCLRAVHVPIASVSLSVVGRA